MLKNGDALSPSATRSAGNNSSWLIVLTCVTAPLLKIGQGRDSRSCHPDGDAPFISDHQPPTPVDETLDPPSKDRTPGAALPQGDVPMPRIISATKRGKYHTILEELSRGVEVDTTDSEGGTPLYWSACKGDLELTRFLISKGANVNHKVNWDATPLHAAADRGHEDCVECLLNGNADVNAQNRNQDTPLHLAAYRGYYQVCLLLLAYNASMTLHNFMGKTPYQEAREAGHSRIVKILDPSTKRGTFPLENKTLGEIYRNKFTTGNGDVPGQYVRQFSEPPQPSLRGSGDFSFGEPIHLSGGADSCSVQHRSSPDISTLSSIPTNVNGSSHPHTQGYTHPALSRVLYQEMSPSSQRTHPVISPQLLEQLQQCTPLPAPRPVYIRTDDRDVYTRIEDLELRLAYAESTKTALEQENIQLRNENSVLRQELSTSSSPSWSFATFGGGLRPNGHHGGRESIESIDATISQLKESLARERTLRAEAESKARQAMKDVFAFRTRFDDLMSAAANSGSDSEQSMMAAGERYSRSDSAFNYEKKGS